MRGQFRAYPIIKFIFCPVCTSLIIHLAICCPFPDQEKYAVKTLLSPLTSASGSLSIPKRTPPPNSFSPATAIPAITITAIPAMNVLFLFISCLLYICFSQNATAFFIHPSAAVPVPRPNPCESPEKLSNSVSMPRTLICSRRFCIVRQSAIPSFFPTQA